MAKIAAKIAKQIDQAVKVYDAKRTDFETDATNLLNRLLANKDLKSLIHSSKWRAKETTHLKDKLFRKAAEAVGKGKAFAITADNVFDKVGDLAGVRLLHLHMRQIERIHPLLMQVFADEGYIISKKPEAKTWDLEYERMFKSLVGVRVKRDESLYTSVHYVIRQNKTTRRLCEVQVRTLAEELWGETSHAINYPHPTESVACKEQLKVLARVVSGSSRLVDAIAASYEDHMRSKGLDVVFGEPPKIV